MPKDSELEMPVFGCGEILEGREAVASKGCGKVPKHMGTLLTSRVSRTIMVLESGAPSRFVGLEAYTVWWFNLRKTVQNYIHKVRYKSDFI